MSSFPYAKQSIFPQDIQAVTEALLSQNITRGPQVAAFETAIASYCGAQYAVVFNSGTTALQAACFAAKVSPQDRIITSPNTFVATLLAGTQRGAPAYFVDIDRSTGNIDLHQMQSLLREKPMSRGRYIILPIHFSGIPVDMELLDRLICTPDVVVIEDAAHALGSKYKNGERVGSCAWSQMTMFSFHPAKVITTGEGGMILTNDPELDHRLRLFRNNGISKNQKEWKADPKSWYPGYHEVQEVTGNYNFTDFQAALGLSQLQQIESFIAKRRALVATYRKHLADLPNVRLFAAEHDSRTAFHLFVVQIDYAAYRTTRAQVMQALADKGIGTQVHYIPLYRHPFYAKRYPDLETLFPETEAYYESTLSLPLYFDLSPEDVVFIAGTLKEILVSARVQASTHHFRGKRGGGRSRPFHNTRS